MLERLKELQEETLQKIEGITDGEELKALETATIGKQKGEVTSILRSIGQLPAEERPAVGQLANQVRQALEEAFAEREDLIKQKELAQSLEEGAIDVTLPGRPVRTGRLHPATRSLREIADIWAEMGFQVYRSPDVVDGRY